MAVRIVFADVTVAGFPGDGELWIRPRDAADRSRRDLATMVAVDGIDALERGAGPIECVRVSTEPTLDEMLAASFARAQLSGEELPEGAPALARYAALVREGLHPGSLPLEESIEGVYLAVLNSIAGDLDEAAVAQAFLGGWERMLEVLWTAAGSGRDPFADALFTDVAELARERAFLREDRRVFEQDVRRGESLVVTLPGAPPSGSALILHEPRSLLFKSWSRQPGVAPDGQPYLLLGVRSGAGQWVFSTDPVLRLSLEELAERLQAAEAATGGAAADDRWFDGAVFAHSLIAAPRGGTQLGDARVLGIVRKWARARRSRRRMPPAVALVAAAGVAGLLLFLGTRLGGRRTAQIDFRTRGAVLEPSAVGALHSEGVRIPGYAILIGVGDGQDDYPALEGAIPGAVRVYNVLRDRYGMAPENLRLLVDRPDQAIDDRGRAVPVAGPPTVEGVLDAIRSLGDEILRYPEGDRTNFVFYYGGHGHKEKRARAIGHLVLDGFDAQRPDVTGMSMTQLAQFLQERIASSHQIMIMDTCFSGFTVVARGIGGSELDASRIYQLWRKRAHVIITAGTRDQQALEFGGRSIFTETLLDGIGESLLADANQDGIVTDAELGAFLNAEVPKAVQFSTGGSHQLTPQYHRGLQGDDVGQFLFVPRI